MQYKPEDVSGASWANCRSYRRMCTPPHRPNVVWAVCQGVRCAHLPSTTDEATINELVSDTDRSSALTKVTTPQVRLGELDNAKETSRLIEGSRMRDSALVDLAEKLAEEFPDLFAGVDILVS